LPAARWPCRLGRTTKKTLFSSQILLECFGTPSGLLRKFAKNLRRICERGTTEPLLSPGESWEKLKGGQCSDQRRICAGFLFGFVRMLFGLSLELFGCTPKNSEQHPNNVNSHPGAIPEQSRPNPEQKPKWPLIALYLNMTYNVIKPINYHEPACFKGEGRPKTIAFFYNVIFNALCTEYD